jgi:glycosyltransferase involved in cell wall biosynthesis
MVFVCVLLATYEGSAYLEDQLKSLESQTFRNFTVIANDDGSTDKTLEILERWKKSGLISILKQTNRIGPDRSFKELLKLVPEGASAAFCDQDDVWSYDKLDRMVNIQQEYDCATPLMITSRRSFIDSNGKSLDSAFKEFRIPSYLNSAIENSAPGNTQFLNSNAIDLALKTWPEKFVKYDAWIYLIMSLCGNVVFEHSVLVKYRIHASNYVGLGNKRSFCEKKRDLEYFPYQAELALNIELPLIEQSRINELNKLVEYTQKKLLSKFFFLPYKIRVYSNSPRKSLAIKLIMPFLKKRESLFFE